MLCSARKSATPTSSNSNGTGTPRGIKSMSLNRLLRLRDEERGRQSAAAGVAAREPAGDFGGEE